MNNVVARPLGGDCLKDSAPHYELIFKASEAQYAQTHRVFVAYKNNAGAAWDMLKKGGFIMVSKRP